MESFTHLDNYAIIIFDRCVLIMNYVFDDGPSSNIHYQKYREARRKYFLLTFFIIHFIYHPASIV